MQTKENGGTDVSTVLLENNANANATLTHELNGSAPFQGTRSYQPDPRAVLQGRKANVN